MAVPGVANRGIDLALATFALGQITRAAILNLEIVGGAAGYPATSFIDLPIILAFTIGVVAFAFVSLACASASPCALWRMMSALPI